MRFHAREEGGYFRGKGGEEGGLGGVEGGFGEEFEVLGGELVSCFESEKGKGVGGFRGGREKCGKG